jgi:hypothetical protein
MSADEQALMNAQKGYFFFGNLQGWNVGIWTSIPKYIPQTHKDSIKKRAINHPIWTVVIRSGC